MTTNSSENVSPSAQPDEEQLRTLVHGLSALLDLCNSCAYIKDSAGRYTFVNKNVQNLFGLASEDILGKDDSHFFDLEVSNQLKTNDRLVLERGESIEREEKDIIKATGEERIYWTIKKPLRDRKGHIVGMCGISTDITGNQRG